MPSRPVEASSFQSERSMRSSEASTSLTRSTFMDPLKTCSASWRTASASSVKEKSTSAPHRSERREGEVLVVLDELDLDGQADLDVLGFDADDVGHQADALLELDQADGQRVVERRDL